MDIKTLIAGYRPVLDEEVGAKAALLAQAGARLAAVEPGAEATFIQGLPSALLSNRFGAPAFENFTTTSMALLNHRHAVADPFKAAILNHLALQLTYQGRFIHDWREPECMALVGFAPVDCVYTMVNVNRLPCYVIDGDEAPTLDSGILSWASTLGLRVGNLVPAKPADIPGIYSGQGLGVIAVDGLDRVKIVGDAVARFGSFVSSDTTFAFFDTADRISAAHAHLRSRHLEADITTRFYRGGATLNGEAQPRRAVLLMTGLSDTPDLAFTSGWRQPLTFVNAADPLFQQQNGGRIVTHGYGREFASVDINGEMCERVDLKSPAVLRSSAPIPIYSRDIIERPVYVNHTVARIRNGGLIHSRDNRHATYINVSLDGELIADFVEARPFNESPLALNSVIQDGRRTTVLENKQVRKIKGPAIPLCFSPVVHEFHSHFLLQCFPRVLLARELSPDAKLLVPWNLRGYQREMLHMVGVSDDRMVPIHPNTVTYCDELIVPQVWPAIFNGYSERIYSELVEKVAPDVRPDPNRRIMISRAARLTWRNLLNFDAIEAVLTGEFGFEVVEPDKLSIHDEIHLFRSSRIIAGAEGAGLYNSCFAHPDSAVLNLADQDYVMYIVGSMAALRGFDVAYVFGESFLADSDLRRRAGHSDFVIEPGLVRSAVRDLIEIMS